MKPILRTHRLLVPWISLGIAWASLSTLPDRAIAAFDPPPNNGTPISTAGGGSRPAQPACVSDAVASKTELTVLAPSRYVGLTDRSRPTVWLYIPPTRAKTVEFSLYDAEHKGIYQTTLPIPGTGLVSLEFPAAAPALTERKAYFWAVALVCNPDRRTDDWVVGGWIERRSRTTAQLPAAGLERVSLLANTGYWYDAIDGLMQLRQTQPPSAALASTWTTLLRSAGLEAISDQPLTSQAN